MAIEIMERSSRKCVFLGGTAFQKQYRQEATRYKKNLVINLPHFDLGLMLQQ
jgi:hypothetical protein